MANKPYRLMYKFWLDINKTDEEAIADKIETLKTKRAFSKTIRDGIRLVCDLRNGKLDVLFELFPWVRAEFMQYIDLQFGPAEQTQEHQSQSIEPQASETQQAWIEAEQERLESERKWNEKRIQDAEKALEAEREKIQAERTQAQKQMQEQLDRLEQILLQQGNLPISGGLEPIGSGGGGPSQNSSGLKPLAVPKFSAPTFDDDDDDMDLTVAKAKGSGNAAKNFLEAMQAMQQ